MKTSAVITIIGLDKPGLVNDVSDTISSYGGNLHESRMVNLAGQFAGLISIQIEQEQFSALKASLNELNEQGMHVTVVRAQNEQTLGDDVQLIALEVNGSDCPGILRDVTAALKQQCVNVEELMTEIRPAPMSSHQLFHAKAQLSAPPTVDLADLQAELESISHDLMIELSKV